VDEVRFLMNFNEGILTRHRDELAKEGVRIRFAGRRDWRVPRRLIRAMDETVAMTAENRKLTLTVAFNYGGRAEIVDAVRALVAEGVKPEQVDERAIRRHLYHPDMPDPDLVVRTSGEYRISNFLLWELAYSELVFVDVLARLPARAPRASGRGVLEEGSSLWRRRQRLGGVELLRPSSSPASGS